MRRLFALIVVPWRPLLLSSVFAFLTIAANIGLMTTSAYLISLAALHPPLATLSLAIVGVRFFGLSRAIARYAERYTGHDAALRLLSEIRIWFFRSLEPLSAAVFTKYVSADLFTRMITDVETLKYLPVRILCPSLVAGILFIALTALLAAIYPPLALWFGVGLSIIGLVIPYFLHRQQQNESVLTSARLQFHAAIVDSIRGLRDLLAFGQVGRIQNDLYVANTRLLSTLHTRQKKNALADAAGQFIASLVFIGSLAMLVSLVRAGKIDGLWLAAWALLIQSSFEAFLPLPLVFRYWQEAGESACRLFSLIPASSDVIAVAHFIPRSPLQLRVKELSFAYPACHTPALEQISFDLFPGKHLAVVGASGSGKSTLISILAGLQSYDSGTICINDINRKSLSPAMLQGSLGVLLQHDYIFHATIADNLRLARPTASEQELWTALGQVFLSDTIRNLPEGLATMLGHDGHGLSGGERRRLSLARLLLKNPEIMLLDEPTAGLDQQLTSRLLVRGGPLLLADRTILLVTHQLAGLQQMDEILVLAHGRIVEKGRLEDLLARRGYFHQLWSLQQDNFTYSNVSNVPINSPY